MPAKVQFSTVCRKNSLTLTPAQLEKIENFSRLLLEWNTKINLISRRDEENFWRRHLVASLSLLFNFRVEGRSRILDLGTGGGLPGIPLAVVLDDCQLTLLDSTRKKIMAVEQIVFSLGLKNVRTYWGRAEESASRPELGGLFDYVIARAVGSISDLILWAKPLLKPARKSLPAITPRGAEKPFLPPGALILLKGGVLDEELEEARLRRAPKELMVYPLIVAGIDAGDLADKKLVVILP